MYLKRDLPDLACTWEKALRAVCYYSCNEACGKFQQHPDENAALILDDWWHIFPVYYQMEDRANICLMCNSTIDKITLNKIVVLYLVQLRNKSLFLIYPGTSIATLSLFWSDRITDSGTCPGFTTVLRRCTSAFNFAVMLKISRMVMSTMAPSIAWGWNCLILVVLFRITRTVLARRSLKFSMIVNHWKDNQGFWIYY